MDKLIIARLMKIQRQKYEQQLKGVKSIDDKLNYLRIQSLVIIELIEKYQDEKQEKKT